MDNPPSKEFLDELVHRAKAYGWSGDYVEIDYFVQSLFDQAGLECPDLEPYLLGDNKDG